MSMIDITSQLKTHQLRAAAVEIYDQRGELDTIHPRMFSRQNVRVTLTQLPQVGGEHPEGKLYTYRFTIPTVMSTFSSDGNLGRFHTPEAAEVALRKHLDTRALRDLRCLCKVFEAYYPTATHAAFDSTKQGFSISTAIPQRKIKWTWLRVSSAVVNKSQLPVGDELVQGAELVVGEREMVVALHAFCTSLQFDNLHTFTRYMSAPSPIYSAQRIAYYYTTANPDEYIVVRVDADIPKPGMMLELSDLVLRLTM